jgi:hypothetical protein
MAVEFCSYVPALRLYSLLQGMKKLLIASLMLNVVTAGALLWFAQQHRATRTENNSPAEKPPAKTNQVFSRTVITTPASETQRITTALDWRMVESEDYKKYITNLRSIGCPEETIRDIITADVNKLFESRRRELNTSTNKFQFWKTGNLFGDMMNPERMEAMQALAKEKRALLKELLGVEPEEKVDLFAGVNPFETMLDFLPSTKQNEVMELYMKFQTKMAKTISGGAPDADDMKEVQKMQKEMEAELAKVLTPQELEDYQLRMSQTAMTMRFQLASFDPNEQEFREIFKAKKQFDDEYSAFGMPSTDKAEREKRTAAEKEMKEALKTTLGEARYAEYERSQDYNYQSIYRVTEKNGLPKDSAIKVYDMKKAAEDEARKVRQDKSLTPEQRTAALGGIRAETEKAIQTVMGDKGYKSYQGQAYWLKGISPDPKD